MYADEIFRYHVAIGSAATGYTFLLVYENFWPQTDILADNMFETKTYNL